MVFFSKAPSIIILKEPVGLRDWLVVVIAFSGIILFFVEQLSANGMLGNVLALFSGLLCALNMVFLRLLSLKSKKIVQFDASLVPLVTVLVGNLVATFLCAPSYGAFGQTSSFTFLVIALLGVFQLGLPFALFSIGIGGISALHAIIYATLEAVLNPIWVILWIGEQPSLYTMLGGGVILLTVIVYAIWNGKSK